MIRQLKYGNEYKYEIRQNIFQNKFWEEEEKVFVNNENFIHNDVGPAYVLKGKVRNNWFWKGILIK